METTLRNQGLAELTAMLQTQQVRKLDVVAPARNLLASDGDLVISGIEPVLGDDGVTMADGTYTVTDIALAGLAEKLDVPRQYLGRILAGRPDIFDATVNGFLHGGRSASVDPLREFEGDKRSFLLRMFRGDDDGNGILRAVLSQGFGIIDHLDVLVAALSGVKASGVEVQVGQCDLTDSRMYVKVQAPSVAALAPELLAGYRSPYSGETGADNPTVFAGFVLTNSETGGGAYTLTPQITVKICNNGMTMTKDVFRRVHLGAKLDGGIVKPSEDTQRKNLELITAQARDTVATFLDPGYLAAKLAELAELAGQRITGPAQDVVETVTRGLLYTDGQRADVLDMFIKGGDLTVGGVMHAVTAAAQRQANADTAHAMEADAVRSMELAAAAA